MFYICTQNGHVIDSRPTKEEADALVVGKNLYVRPSPETQRIEESRQEFNRMNMAVQS